MRPVERGSHPKDEKENDVTYKEYQQARGELIRRLGEYCSYCEMHLDSSLAVEHVRPKKPPGASVVDRTRELEWTNFLLACTNCNSTKGDTDVALDDYLWPDRDNTFRALSYTSGGKVAARDGDFKQKAENIISLTGLDKTPNEDTASDRRWLNRREAWDMAVRSKGRLSRNDSGDFREQIIETAVANGFWSAWMTVFESDADMLKRLIVAFKGTASSCFDTQNGYAPIARNGGQC